MTMGKSQNRPKTRRGLRSDGKPPRSAFTKGKSGNPGGRPKGIAARVKELVGNDGEKALKVLWDIATGKLTITQHAVMTGAPYQATPGFRDRREAIKELLDRGFGKPREPVDLTTRDGEPRSLDLSKLTDAELDQFTALLAAAAPDPGSAPGGEGSAAHG
jgi:hypothetical protein